MSVFRKTAMRALLQRPPLSQAIANLGAVFSFDGVASFMGSEGAQCVVNLHIIPLNGRSVVTQLGKRSR
jgi:hypothetical protein